MSWKESMKIKNENLGVAIMLSSLFWLIGFMFGSFVVIFCLICGIGQAQFGYYVAIKGWLETLREYCDKGDDCFG